MNAKRLKILQPAAKLKTRYPRVITGDLYVLPSHANPAIIYQTRFHGGNTGSSPVGDTNQFSNLTLVPCPPVATRPDPREESVSPLLQALSRILPQRQVITDPLRRLAYGTDASFYRMVPEVVAVVETEQEVQALLQVARAHCRPVTFRAAGTSLSGQAMTDGVLALIGENFETCEISSDASTVRLGPGIVGGEVNRPPRPIGTQDRPRPGLH